MALIDTSRFAPDWWYQTSFTVPATEEKKRIWLHFNGINDQASVWLNGQQIATKATITGFYTDYEFDVTSYVVADGKTTNYLAVDVQPPGDYSFDNYFLDWAATPPPDLNMGIWQDVFIQSSGSVKMRNSFVSSDLAVPSLATAALSIYTDVTNTAGTAVNAALSGSIINAAGAVVATFNKNVSVPANAATTEISVTSADAAALTLKDPDVWWPWQWGAQPLYTLQLTLTCDGQPVDTAVKTFGVRKVESSIVAGVQTFGTRKFTINGQDLLIRGGAYSNEYLLRHTPGNNPEWIQQVVNYAKDMHINAIRTEGKLDPSEDFYNALDQAGILLIADWMAGQNSGGRTAWEDWEKWSATDWSVHNLSLQTQLRHLRSHPSVIAWGNGSDFMASPVAPGFYTAQGPRGPNPQFESNMVAIETALHWPDVLFQSAEDHEVSAVSGPTGFGMNGPYSVTYPMTYFQNTDGSAGNAAYGFTLESSPGSIGLPLETMNQILSPANRWPQNGTWNTFNPQFNASAGYLNDLNTRYGTAVSLEDYTWKSEATGYELQRGAFEAVGAHRFTTSFGYINWLMNSPMPNMAWHLFDYYMRPGGLYFGMKIANEPVHINYDYDDGRIDVDNETLTPLTGLTATAQFYSIDGTLINTLTAANIAVAANSRVSPLASLPLPAGLTNTYFLRLQLTDSSMAVRSLNTYWLSKTGNGTSTANLTGLANLGTPNVSLSAVSTVAQGANSVTSVTVTNGSSAVAMLVRLQLWSGTAAGPEVLPILWNDNYLVLQKNESRVISATYATSALAGATPLVTWKAYNSRGGNIDAALNRYESEHGTIGGGAQIIADPAASNGIAVGFLNAVGSYTQISGVDGGAGGGKTLSIVYASQNSNQSMNLYVNNVFVKTVAFGATGGYSNYTGTVTATISLNPGAVNTVKLQNDQGNAGDANIDYMHF